MSRRVQSAEKACSTKLMAVDGHQPAQDPTHCRTERSSAHTADDATNAAPRHHDALASLSLLRPSSERTSTSASAHGELDALAQQSILRASFNSNSPPIQRLRKLTARVAAIIEALTANADRRR